MKILNSNTKNWRRKNNGSDNCPTIQGMKQKNGRFTNKTGNRDYIFQMKLKIFFQAVV